MPNQNYVFLLGGYDLEMITIKELLLQNGYELNKNIFDKNLTWNNAEWKQYANEINASERLSQTIAGTELRETDDYKKRNGWIDIDHHNERSSEPSSLEQVAKLIDADVSKRYYQLIIANDKGYIPAMKAINATDDEIQAIRRKDRAAQGVREEEEMQAEQDIQHAKVENGVTIIYTTINHFSAITDRLNADKLIVYSDSKLNYYGVGANTFVKDAFKDLIEERKAYYGGSGEGFFGVGEGVLGREELERIKNRIVHL